MGSHHQAEMAWTSLLVIGVLICTVVYSDIQFTSDSDPLINHNLLAYLSSREDLVSYLSSYSNNIADTTLDSLSSAEYYEQLCQEASRGLSDQVISGLQSVPELAQKARANYLEKLMQSNIEAALAFGTYILGLTSILDCFWSQLLPF